MKRNVYVCAAILVLVIALGIGSIVLSEPLCKPLAFRRPCLKWTRCGQSRC